MTGSPTPIYYCDAECARANHCTIGGFRCKTCGHYFCADELNEDGECIDCEESRLDLAAEAERESEDD